MKSAQTSLGPLGSKFFALMQMKNQKIVRLGELQKPLGLSDIQERKLLQRLADNGYLLRLQRGIYLVPPTIPAGGYWRPNEYYIIDKFMQIHKAKYYISGMAAFNYHNLTEQIANQYTVYNDKISGIKKFGTLAVQFIKISENRITGFIEISLANDEKAYIASLARTILDTINDWKRYQKITEAYAWLSQYKKDNELMSEFIQLTQSCANMNATRRIGYTLEGLGLSEKQVLPLYKKLKSIQSWVPLIPNISARGTAIKKWRIIDNAKQHP